MGKLLLKVFLALTPFKIMIYVLVKIEKKLKEFSFLKVKKSRCNYCCLYLSNNLSLQNKSEPHSLFIQWICFSCKCSFSLILYRHQCLYGNVTFFLLCLTGNVIHPLTISLQPVKKKNTSKQTNVTLFSCIKSVLFPQEYRIHVEIVL